MATLDQRYIYKWPNQGFEKFQLISTEITFELIGNVSDKLTID